MGQFGGGQLTVGAPQPNGVLEVSGIIDRPSGLRTRGGELLQQLRIIFEHLAGKCLRFANFII